MSLETAKRVLRIEAEAIAGLIERLDARFERAVELLYGCKGRVVVTGMGKSGLIGRKIAATFASTGTPSLFLHAAEAAHGDLGMLVGEDVVLAISTSGETEELLDLLESLKRLGDSTRDADGQAAVDFGAGERHRAGYRGEGRGLLVEFGADCFDCGGFGDG